MKIIIENSLYSLLVCILLIKDWKNSIFILDAGGYSKLIEDKVYICYRYQDYSLKKKPISYYFQKIKLFLFCMRNRIWFNSEIIIYGDDLLLKYFFKKRETYLIEDGTWNYKMRKKEGKIKRIIRFENPFYMGNGLDNNIKKIYLTGMSDIPKEIAHKVELINLKELWRKKTKEEQKEILEIFNFSINDIDILKRKKNILFTQPLSEDGTLKEKEKILIYTEILKNYDFSDTIIKKHPREKTRYEKYFEGIEVLDGNFPAELLDILEIKFKKAITIFSSAVLTIDGDIEIDFYGTEIHKKILKKFGTMEDIMQRNSFLKKDNNE